ncbi:MAG: hypothetical protein HDR12_05005 [Lachnospiraceae bacterium]|nr:hypothetical protein [Lachnospiraceae bacterium]
MGKKNKRIHQTIEGQLEYYYRNGQHTERNGILWHAWCQNRRWLSQLLETTMGSFPAYSKHDESHAKTVLHNIEMILGEKRIRDLSASDCFMLLHTVYIHDIGMVITYEERKKIVNNNKFIDMIKEMEDENDPVFQRAIKALQKQDYAYTDVENEAELMKKLYSDKLEVYYAILHLLATFRRPEHGEVSDERLEEWTLQSEKLGGGFSMAGIPQRIFLWIAKCAGLHTESKFENIMNLPQEDDGYASDYLHPRFVAVLLQLGDILDMDNDRFHPLTRECIGALPELSQRHYEKHQAIRRLYIKQDRISIEADCNSQEALRLVRKECDMLRNILTEAGYYWSQICPDKFRGSLPTIESVKLYLKGFQIPEELVTAQFRISQKKAFAILEGSNVYKEQFVFLREFLQNAIDASKIQYWNECIRTRGYFENKNEMKKMSPDQLGDILSTDVFPIEIEMEIVRKDAGKEAEPIDEEDVKTLIEGKRNDSRQYGVKVRIKDFGTGIDKESIKSIASVGDSRKKDKYVIQDMPEWLKPTAEFGIGLQSAFILANTFKCNTYTRSNEKYEITFSTVKSNYYEGYINVSPVENLSDKDNSYGTCFEVFVPVTKKLLHELYPAAWDGMDYFDEEYDVLRPLRHSAELLAQMALYLDTIIGEQLFPIHLNVKECPHATIPLNLNKKNQIKKLKYNLIHDTDGVKKSVDTEKTELAEDGELKSIIYKNFEWEQAKIIIKLFQEREWERSGKAWSLYHKNYQSKKSKYEKSKGLKNEIVVEKTENAIALLDCRNGHLYYWDNELCTFCLMNMANFLSQEKQQTENSDKHCEKNLPNVKIYYKGILLEERELPGIGNELLQYIDIKGKLERECVSLSRKGFTEKGRKYFLQEIYEPLLKSVLKTLKIMNQKHAGEVVKCVEDSLADKVNVLKALTKKIEQWKNGDERIVGTADQNKWIDRFVEKKNQLLVMFKENVVSITMLAFFAQKDVYDPLVEIGCGNECDAQSCWDKAIDAVQMYCGKRKSGKDGKMHEGFWDPSMENSVLFHIEHRSQIDLEEDLIQETTESGWITFPDIFLRKNQFMVVSKRENRSAPWKQYLTPICCSGENKEKPGIIQCLKKYSVIEYNSDEKRKMEVRILKMGERALLLADTYGTDAYGGDGAMNPDEYLQQYFLKWLLRYIPTVALFMSEDGNTRVNILHGKTFPFVFMNMYTKKLILQRIIKEAEGYDIQRFSIPAWQGLENLSCRSLPYSHYFVKRGYMAEESYSKVIFPFAKDELIEIDRQIHSDKVQNTIQGLQTLQRLLNVRQQLINILPESERKVAQLLEKVRDEEQKEAISREYQQFLREFQTGISRGRKILAKVRTEYRNLVVLMLNQKEGEPEFKLEDLEEISEKWDDIYIWLMLRVIYSDYVQAEAGLQEEDLGITKENKKSLGEAWYYIWKEIYMQDAKNVLLYEESYMEKMERGIGTAHQKRERILDYIEQYRSNVLRREYLQNCWMRYVSEIFELFRNMEEKQYHIMEGQADWEGIKKELSRKEKEETNDADN